MPTATEDADAVHRSQDNSALDNRARSQPPEPARTSCPRRWPTMPPARPPPGGCRRSLWTPGSRSRSCGRLVTREEPWQEVVDAGLAITFMRPAGRAGGAV